MWTYRDHQVYNEDGRTICDCSSPMRALYIVEMNNAFEEVGATPTSLRACAEAVIAMRNACKEANNRRYTYQKFPTSEFNDGIKLCCEAAELLPDRIVINGVENTNTE